MSAEPAGLAADLRDVRTRARVTGRASVPTVVRVRTPWPEQATFIAYLDELKKRRGIRYDNALAEAAEISHTSISNWRSGKQRPSLEAITALAATLGVDAHDLAVCAGIAQGLTKTQPQAPLPAELDHLIDQYRTADEDRRTELLDKVRWVTEWFDATNPSTSRTRRRAG